MLSPFDMVSAFDMVRAILSRSSLKFQRKSRREYPRDLSSLQKNEVERRTCFGMVSAQLLIPNIFI